MHKNPSERVSSAMQNMSADRVLPDSPDLKKKVIKLNIIMMKHFETRGKYFIILSL